MREAITQTLRAANNSESYVRLVITRGSGEVGLDMSLATDPTTLVIAKPLLLPTADMYQHGVAVQLVQVQRTSARAMDPAVKSGNYLNNILALAEARATGAHEAIMCDREGFLAEGSSSNLFFRFQGQWQTPSLEVGLLAGITRRRVLLLAESLGIPVCEGHFPPENLLEASEAFLTSSVRGILPISSVSGTVLKGGAPGPTCKKLMDAYADFLSLEAEAL